MAIGRFGVNGRLARGLAMVERRLEDGHAQTLGQVGMVLHVSEIPERFVRVTSLLFVKVERFRSIYLAFLAYCFSRLYDFACSLDSVSICRQYN